MSLIYQKNKKIEQMDGEMTRISKHLFRKIIEAKNHFDNGIHFGNELHKKTSFCWKLGLMK